MRLKKNRQITAWGKLYLKIGQFFGGRSKRLCIKISEVKFNPDKIYPLARLAKIDALLTDSPNSLRPDWELFASGRCALWRIFLKMAKSGFCGRIFLPRYFCPTVLESVRKFYKVEFFEDLPSEKSPRFETLKAKTGDAVMAVNFFGLRDMRIWRDWKACNPDIILIENASHVPFTVGETRADYAFGSLRKYLPLTDGGFAIAQNPSPIFRKPASSLPDFAADFLAASAMRLRGFSGAEDFSEKLFYSAEAKIAAHLKSERISAYALETLLHIDIKSYSEARYKTVAAFADAVRGNKFFDELTFAGYREPKVASVYCPVLKFRERRIRDFVYSSLRAEKMFAPIYWGGFGNDASPATLAESATILCIPPHFADTAQEAENFGRFILGHF